MSDTGTKVPGTFFNSTLLWIVLVVVLVLESGRAHVQDPVPAH
jgi:hypothetical protein